MTQHFDIVIVGAGPAGLAAATAAVAAGKRIAVLDENPRAGGQVWRQGPGRARTPQLSKALHALHEAGRVTLMNGTRAVASARSAEGATTGWELSHDCSAPG